MVQYLVGGEQARTAASLSVAVAEEVGGPAGSDYPSLRSQPSAARSLAWLGSVASTVSEDQYYYKNQLTTFF